MNTYPNKIERTERGTFPDDGFAERYRARARTPERGEPSRCPGPDSARRTPMVRSALTKA